MDQGFFTLLQAMERTEQESSPRSESPVSTTPGAAQPRGATSRALARTEAKGASRAEGRAEGRSEGRAEARTEVRVPTGAVAPVSSLPPIPAKRYFTIGEVSELCGVKPYVLRYWEQEFTQLRPMKRRGNRRYYQHHEVLLIRRIRELLYEQGFTISGARNQLHDHAPATAQAATDVDAEEASGKVALAPDVAWTGPDLMALAHSHPQAAAELREALLSIRDLLS